MCAVFRKDVAAANVIFDQNVRHARKLHGVIAEVIKIVADDLRAITALHNNTIAHVVNVVVFEDDVVRIPDMDAVNATINVINRAVQLTSGDGNRFAAAFDAHKRLRDATVGVGFNMHVFDSDLFGPIEDDAFKGRTTCVG